MVTSTGITGYGVYKGDGANGRLKMTTTFDGFNPSSIIDAIRSGNQDIVDIEQGKIDKVKEKTDAFQKISDDEVKWKETLADLRGYSIMPGKDSGVFAITTASSAGIAGNPANNYATVSLDPGVEPRDFTFGVTQLASKDSIKSVTTIANDSTALNWTGNLVFPNKTAGQPDITINVTASMSLKDINSAVNGMRDLTGVASEIIPSDGAYKISFAATDYARPITYTNTIAAAGDGLPQLNYAKGSTGVVSDIAALNWAGSITFPHVDGVSPAVSIAVANNQSLQTIRDNINLETANTGVTAAILNTGGTNYLTYTRADGKPISVTNAVAGVTTELPVSTVKTTSSLSAKVTYRGEVSEHRSNSPKINGITFNLINTTPSDLTYTVNYSPALAAESIQKWVEAQNSFVDLVRSYVLTQEDDKGNRTLGLLSGNSFLRDMENTLSTIVSQISNANAPNGSPKYLADIGIGMSAGKLTLDMTKLLSSLNSNFKGVRNLFTFSTTTSNANFDIVGHPPQTHTNLLTGTSTVNLSKAADGTLSAEMVDKTGVHYGLSASSIESYDNGASYILTGAAGTPFEGISIYYGKSLANGETATTTFTCSQGISDRLDVLSDKWLNPVKGDFLEVTDGFAQEKSAIQEKMDRIEKANATRLALIERQLEKVMEVRQKYSELMSMARAIDHALNPTN